MIDVSIVIVNYNTLELTRDTINSVVQKTKGLQYEIILVDNCSIDGSREFFENIFDKEIHFIKSDENIGFGRANNLGIDIAKGEKIFFLNPDTILINNAIKILYNFMQNNLECGVCGGNLYTRDMKPNHSFRKRAHSLFTEIRDCFNLYEKISFYFFNKRKDFNYTNKNIEVGYIIGADMMVSKSVIDKVGGFDKDIFMYYEDVELSCRIKKQGLKIFNVPEAKIIHLEGQSFIFKEERYRRQIQGKYMFFKKIYGMIDVQLLCYITILKLLLKCCVTLKTDYLKMIRITIEEYKNLDKINF
ncbi:hypothetical protein IX293_002169 [Fusobacterium necrophorum]|nr:hypothetical protein [Fusobacterium necrophorum]